MRKYLGLVFEMHAYCLMPNHFHWLIKVKEKNQMIPIFQGGVRGVHQPMSNMFNAYAKAINKRYGRMGSLFQEHIHRIKIVDERYFKQVLILSIKTHIIMALFMILLNTSIHPIKPTFQIEVPI